MQSAKKQKKRWNLILPVLFLLAGAALVLYPWLSEYVYEHRTDSLVDTYTSQVETESDLWLQEQWQEAVAYNEKLSASGVTLTDPFGTTSGQETEYENLLNCDGSGLMGFVEIPSIGVYLPIYHGTDPEVLEHGIGHLKGSSLPVGGPGSHAVLSGHTGLNAAKMFTDLENVEQGDYFLLHILDQTLTYRVVDRQVVEPEDTSLLEIDGDRDLVTLVTCTPYGVNSHRLLVIGERTANLPEEETVTRASTDVSSQWSIHYKKALLFGLLAAGVILGILWLIRKKGRQHRGVGSL